MAAAYTTGSASSPTDLLDQLAAWLVTQGWTQDSLATDGSGKRGHLHKGAVYVNLRAAVNETVWPNLSGSANYGLHLYLGTGYSGASGWAAQAGGPIKSGASDTVGACMRLLNGGVTAFHFFDDGSDRITIAVERPGALFTHIGFGVTLDKSGTWTGGPYFYGALPGRHGGSVTQTMGDANSSAGAPGAVIGPFFDNSTTQLGHALFVRVDVDSFTSKWIGCSGTNTTANDGYTGKLGNCGLDYNTLSEILPTDFPGYQRLLGDHLVSAFNGQAVKLPIRVYVARDGGGYSLIGEVPEVFCYRGVGNGVLAGAVVSINGKNYMAFPNFAVRKRA